MNETLGNILGIALLLSPFIAVAIFWLIAVILKIKRLKKNRNFINKESQKQQKIIEQQQQIIEMQKQRQEMEEMVIESSDQLG